MLLSQKSNSNLALRNNVENIPLQQYKTGEEINFFDSGIWQVYRGVVQLSRIQLNGSVVIMGWVTSNGVFSQGLEDRSSPYLALALTDVYARRYALTDLEKNYSLTRQLLTQSSDRLVKTQQLLQIIAIRKVEDRLKALFFLLGEEIGQAVVDGVRLQVRFTHQHLAEAIHTTRVTVTRTLGDFQHRGLIYFDRDKHIVIKGVKQ